MFTITITITQDENNKISVSTNEPQPTNKEPKQKKEPKPKKAPKKAAKPRKKKVEFQQLDTTASFIPVDDDGIVPFDED